MQTTIGEGRAVVDVEYTIDEFDYCEITSVEFESVNIIPVLTEAQMEDIEDACFADSKKKHEDNLYDIGADRYERRMYENA